MCRWVAYLGEPIFLEEFVTTPRQSLIVQSRHSREAKSVVNGDGFGLGWYGDREEPGLFRDVRPAWSDENLLSLARQIRSRLFFAHVRASTGTATTRANCHPFQHGKWLFMHNGKVGGWDRLRRPIEAAIPDSLFRHRQGTTDSEAIFLLLLANGLETDVQAACARTISFIGDVMRGAGETEPLRVTAAFSDGSSVYGLRHASDATPETLYVRRRRTRDGTLVVSEPLDDGRDDWEAVPPESLVTLGPEGLRIDPFQLAAAA
jgi:glutamine amidotransferase